MLRLVHYAVLLAAFIFIVLGGLDAFTGSYETLTSWVGFIPQGPGAALAVAAVGNVLLGHLLQRRAGDGVPPGARPLA